MLLGLILAAGQGSRFGAPKVTVQQGDWLKNCIRALEFGGCDEIRVLLGAAIVTVPSPELPLVVSDYKIGLSRTLLYGVQYALNIQADAIIILPVDMPDISAEIIQEFIIRAQYVSSEGHAQVYRNMLARAVYQGIPGHPVLIGSDYFVELQLYLSQAQEDRIDAGARGFLQLKSLLNQVNLIECSDIFHGRDYDYPEECS